MNVEQVDTATGRTRLGWVLIIAGALVLAARLLHAGEGWLWTGLAGGAFLLAYARQRTRALLLLGGILSGLAIGLLLGAWGVPGGTFLALGAALMVIDRIEPEPGKRVMRLGAALAAFGLLYGLATSGWLHDGRLAIVLILVGALLLLGSRGPRSSS